MNTIKKYLTAQNIAIGIISIILLQTLPFKFLALPESVALFTKLGQEPRGRIGTGILELL
jgi:putative oxidoreductase